MSTIELTVSQVRGLTLASAKGDVRYYLNGSLFDFETGRAVSTDGHCLLAVNVAAQWNPAAQPLAGACIIPRDALEAVSKGGKITDGVTVTFDGEAVKLQRAGGVTIEAAPIQGTFPQWERVVPDNFTGEPAQFNPELLARISKAYGLAVNNARNCKPAIAYNGLASALVYNNADAETAIAVIMPWKNDDNPKAALSDFNQHREQIKAA